MRAVEAELDWVYMFVKRESELVYCALSSCITLCLDLMLMDLWREFSLVV